MGFLGALWLIVLGLAVSPNVVIARKPDLEAKLKLLTQFANWMGVLSLVWGVTGIFSSLALIGRAPILSIVGMTASVMHFALGMLLSFHLVREWLPTSIRNRAGMLRLRLAQYEFRLGVAGVCVGVGLILAWMFFGPR